MVLQINKKNSIYYMKQHVPLFEEYIQINENLLIDQIYESVLITISENEERELSRGEKAAVTRGDIVGEEWQFAYAYLYVNDNLGQFGSPGYIESADYVYPMPLSTFARLTRKFRDLEDGVTPGEDDQGNILNPKVVDAYTKFKDMHINDVIAIASSGMNMEEVGASDAIRAKAAEGSAKRKAGEKSIADTLKELISSLTMAGVKNPEQKALSRLSSDINMDINRLRELYRKQFKIDIRPSRG